MNNELLYEVADGIGRVTFNRPEARNAMLFSMYQRVVEICAEAEKTGLRALIFTGAGEKAFASGTDISQFRAFKTPQDAMAYEQRIGGVLSAPARCPPASRSWHTSVRTNFFFNDTATTEIYTRGPVTR